MKAKSSTPTHRWSRSDITPAAIEARGGWLEGTVVLVEPTQGLLALRAGEARKKLFIHWLPETQFTIDGHPGSSVDLRLGQRVRLHCRFTNEEWEADNIAIE